MRCPLLAAAFLCAFFEAHAQPAAEPPRTWVDSDTGHRVVRLTDEPGSASLYFNQNGYTADGRKMIYTTPNGISALDLETRASQSIVIGRVRVMVTGRKTPNVYYIKGSAVFVTNAGSSADQLDRGLDALAARSAEEHLGEPAARTLAKARRKLAG